MTDYWNDPPDSDLPECCGEEMLVDTEGNCKCELCGKVIVAPLEPDPALEPIDEPVDLDWMEHYPAECPHSNPWHACDACDHASDIAYDAARERG